MLPGPQLHSQRFRDGERSSRRILRDLWVSKPQHLISGLPRTRCAALILRVLLSIGAVLLAVVLHNEPTGGMDQIESADPPAVIRKIDLKFESLVKTISGENQSKQRLHP